MESLRSKVAQIAEDNAGLRKHLVPLLKGSAETENLDVLKELLPELVKQGFHANLEHGHLAVSWPPLVSKRPPTWDVHYNPSNPHPWIIGDDYGASDLSDRQAVLKEFAGISSKMKAPWARGDRAIVDKKIAQDAAKRMGPTGPDWLKNLFQLSKRGNGVVRVINVRFSDSGQGDEADVLAGGSSVGLPTHIPLAALLKLPPGAK